MTVRFGEDGCRRGVELVDATGERESDGVAGRSTGGGGEVRGLMGVGGMTKCETEGGSETTSCRSFGTGATGGVRASGEAAKEWASSPAWMDGGWLFGRPGAVRGAANSNAGSSCGGVAVFAW